MGKRRRLRLPSFGGTDIASLRTRWTVGVVLFGSFFLGLWLLATDRASENAYLEREEARLEAVAASAAVAIDGDRLLREGSSNESLDRMVVELAASQGLSASVSVLVPIATESGAAGLRVLAASLPVDGERPTTSLEGDERLSRMLEGNAALVSRVTGGHLVSFAPVWANDHSVAALVCVEGSIERPELDRSLSRAGLSVVGLIVLFILTRATDSFAARHVRTLTRIASGEGTHSLGRFPSREVLELAQAMEHPAGASAPAAQPAPAPRAPIQPAPQPHVRTSPAAAPRERAPTTQMPAAEAGPATPPATGPGFSPVHLATNLVGPHRKRAEARGVHLTVTSGSQVPATVPIDPAPVHEALDVLLANAVAKTREGSVRVRVAFDGTTSERGLLRFDVIDTGCGIALADRNSLASLTETAVRRARAGAGPAPKSGLARAAYVAAGLGGDLGFESQKGCGSRFWFTVRA